MLIEIHMIQNHSPSNLNRDDMGAPKTCLFGGVTRARISSQCLKRSIRNPGNPADIHKREPGIFAKAMSAHIGIRTKFFPDLVKQALMESEIPNDEHLRIVQKAQTIAKNEEKQEKKTPSRDTSDPRPKTSQLIHFGKGHAKFFVQKLVELRKEKKECYDYYLNPVAGFQEIVRENLIDSGLEMDVQEKIVGASWLVAKCRMKDLRLGPEGDVTELIPESDDEQPGDAHAKLIADILSEIHQSDPERFKVLTKRQTEDEKRQLKQEAPKKPKDGMNEFMASLKAVNQYDAVDIALFGRMTTSDAFEDVEAAMQVAHAISTHAIINEVDYFTAVDDLGKTGGGAAHVDELMFNSACFYKYFCLDWEQLVENLSGPMPDQHKDAESYIYWMEEIKPQAERLAACTLGHFLLAAALSTPSGKQNNFAANNEPCGILIEIKKNKMPTSYANAFAEPVERIGRPAEDSADEKSLEGRSVACLADHVQALRKSYNIDSSLLWYSPKLWRFPLQYWQRSENGQKTIAKLVTEKRFDILEGTDGEQEGLIEALVKGLGIGYEWTKIKNIGNITA